VVQVFEICLEGAADTDTQTGSKVISRAVSRWLPTAAARVRVWVECGACGGQSGAGAGFLRVLVVPLPIVIPPISPS
jgi:hypothetical protein